MICFSSWKLLEKRIDCLATVGAIRGVERRVKRGVDLVWREVVWKPTLDNVLRGRDVKGLADIEGIES